MKVFVYGTLMRGFGNHVLMDGSPLLGEGKTTELFTMHAIGFPFISRLTDFPVQVEGEVYEVEENIVERNLDPLEGHPNWYCREEIEIVMKDTGEKIAAWAYINPAPHGVIVESGSFRAHTGRYVEGNDG